MAVFDELDDEVQKLTKEIEEMKDEMGVEDRDPDPVPETDETDDDDEPSAFMKEIQETMDLIDAGNRSEAIERYSELALEYRKRKVDGKLTDDEEQALNELHDRLDTAKEG